MKKNKINSIQDWIPYHKILDNGIIELKDNSYIKIIKIDPINFNLKSDLEKESILNSYKIFLKTCNFNFQILIQSNKEDLTKHISDIKEYSIQEDKNIINISDKYIEYINSLNHEKKSSSKNFYIVLKYFSNKEENNINLIYEELNDKYFKIKDCLSRCGNFVTDFSNKDQIIDILFSFLNSRIFLENY